MELLHKTLTDSLIKVFYEVYNELGYGFLERVYQNAMFLELRDRNFKVEAQKRIKVYFKTVEVGEYFADLLIDDTVIIELKAADAIVPEHENQLINYLKSTEIEVGLLFNFGPKPEFIRKVFQHKRNKPKP